MSVPLQRIRLPVAFGSDQKFTDKITNRTPFIWRGTDLQFEIAVFYNGELLDVSNLTSLTLEVKPFTDPSEDAVMTKTITVFNTTLTDEQWAADTHQHALVEFDHEESAPDIGDDKERPFWLVISAIRNDAKKLTFGATSLLVKEDGTGSEASPEPGDPDYLTNIESEALFMPKAGTGSNVRFKDGEGLQWYDPTAVGWRTQVLNDGVVGWGPPEA